MRVALAICGLLSAVFAPAVVTVLILIALTVRYPAYEALAIGLLTDFLWQPAGFHMPYFTLVALVGLWGFAPLRKEFMVS